MNNEFIEVPANKKSLTMRKLVFDLATNDATYQVQPTINGKQVICPYYKVWKQMLCRCYYKPYQENQPTYIKCSVCKEWLIFSKFKEWMIVQDWKGKELDKDILVSENNIYSPDTCCFVSKKINGLLHKNVHRRNGLPIGVYIVDGYKHPYSVCCRTLESKTINLGRYSTEQEAHEVYCTYKANLIKKIAYEQTDVRIKNALITRANTIHLVE